MTINDKTRDEKLQCNINRKAAKVSPLLSRKADKYEYLTKEEIQPSNQRQTIEQAKFVYSPQKSLLKKTKQKQLNIKEKTK